jgi:hypothetical protein
VLLAPHPVARRRVEKRDIDASHERTLPPAAAPRLITRHARGALPPRLDTVWTPDIAEERLTASEGETENARVYWAITDSGFDAETRNHHGKEGIDGSNPLESFAGSKLQLGTFCSPSGSEQ